ncbi:hypothetical protein RJ641_027588 [Dillenia turbinata]|uniref:Uncharacterized protein n=1 Tax=Dillenia turbinata TaxID=194707 RepID=A0AAN8ZLG3_9MAGN
MATSSRRSGNGPVLRSLSPSGRFYSRSPTSPSAAASAFASSTSSFSSRSSTFFHRSASPTRVNLYSSPSPSSSHYIKFSLDHSVSPNRSIHVTSRKTGSTSTAPKKTCMCSPTTHPGSFRCSLHKNFNNHHHHPHHHHSVSNRLNARRSAMTNSLVRIGTVEGDLVKRALAALIRPSSHQQQVDSPSCRKLTTYEGEDDDSDVGFLDLRSRRRYSRRLRHLSRTRYVFFSLIPRQCGFEICLEFGLLGLWRGEGWWDLRIKKRRKKWTLNHLKPKLRKKANLVYPLDCPLAEGFQTDIQIPRLRFRLHLPPPTPPSTALPPPHHPHPFNRLTPLPDLDPPSW